MADLGREGNAPVQGTKYKKNLHFDLEMLTVHFIKIILFTILINLSGNKNFSIEMKKMIFYVSIECMHMVLITVNHP